MPGSRRSGLRGSAFWSTTRRVTGKKAVITCAVCRGDLAMVKDSGGSKSVFLMSTPKDAAAVILLRQNTDPNHPEVFWIKRSDKLAFLGGFHAFPGGQLDATDSEVP